MCLTDCRTGCPIFRASAGRALIYAETPHDPIYVFDPQNLPAVEGSKRRLVSDGQCITGIALVLIAVTKRFCRSGENKCIHSTEAE